MPVKYEELGLTYTPCNAAAGNFDRYPHFQMIIIKNVLDFYK